MRYFHTIRNKLSVPLTVVTIFFFVQCIIKQLLDSVFMISRIIKVSVRVISLSLRLQLITPTSTLIILDITKTSSNNCLEAAKINAGDNVPIRFHPPKSVFLLGLEAL